MGSENIIKSENFETKQFCIVVPVYNIREWLPKCLESIDAQLSKNFNVILVDDGSTDGSEELCDDFVKDHDDCMVIHKDNKGIVAARNQAINMTDSEYICFVDGDDWISREYIKTLEWVINESPDNKDRTLDIVYFSHKAVYEDHIDSYRAIDTVGYFDRAELQDLIFPKVFKLTTFLAAWTSAFRKDLLVTCLSESAEIMKNSFAFTYECLYKAEHIYVVPKVLYYYNRENEDIEYRKQNLPADFESKLYSVIHLYRRFKDADKEILDQLCFAFFQIVASDFFSFESAKEANAFKNSLNTEQRELIRRVAEIMEETLNQDVENYSTVRRGIKYLKGMKFRSLYHLANMSKIDIYEEL